MDKTNSNYGAVVVTGASRGLGNDMALYLSTHGFHVFAGCRKPSDFSIFPKELSDRLTPLLLDVTDEKSITEAVEKVTEYVGAGGLSGIVNNAGIAVFGPVEQVSITKVEEQLRVNVLGPIAVIQKFLPLLRLAKGRIVNISSVNGFLSPQYMGIYSASKFALEALSDSLRLELKPWGVSVSVVQPGLFISDIRAKSIKSWKAHADRLPEAERENYASGFEKTKRLIIGFDQAAADPEQVSEAVFQALTAEAPQARYLVGETAQQMVGMLSLTDEARDQALLQMWEKVT